MKYWIINNTKFGYKNNSKEWSQNMFDYFENHFIPFLKKHAKPNDKLIHLGNIFNTSENINIPLLLKVEDLFVKISSILPVVIVDVYNEKTNISKILQNTNQIGEPLIERINYITKEFIPYGHKTIDNIPDNGYLFVNSRIDKDVLKKYPNVIFFCGYHDDRLEEDNVIYVGAPYQLEKTSDDKGFYVLDTKSKKYKFVKNNYSPKYNTITITDISQIDDLDPDFIDKNKVSIIVDKTLIDEKKVKIDVLLSKYNFKSVRYSNDDQKEETVDSSSMNMEELIREKIENSDNPELMSEFENIMKIYKEKY
jgi:hypothetical protein